mmetsp:Transcript_48223/g.155195  ORF Transcript_48223/g.155195 Transcript_48223/m.155195 type:complete len:209 (-) Transcript_48223:410-1036(-)
MRPPPYGRARRRGRRGGRAAARMRTPLRARAAALRCPSGWRQPRRRSFGMCPSSSSAARVSPTSARHGARPRRRRRRRRRPGWRRCVRRGRGRWRSGWRGGRRSPHGRRRSVTWLGRRCARGWLGTRRTGATPTRRWGQTWTATSAVGARCSGSCATPAGSPRRASTHSTCSASRGWRPRTWMTRRGRTGPACLRGLRRIATSTAIAT